MEVFKKITNLPPLVALRNSLKENLRLLEEASARKPKPPNLYENNSKNVNPGQTLKGDFF